jgi:hypothetical protein
VVYFFMSCPRRILSRDELERKPSRIWQTHYARFWTVATKAELSTRSGMKPASFAVPDLGEHIQQTQPPACQYSCRLGSKLRQIAPLLTSIWREARDSALDSFRPISSCSYNVEGDLLISGMTAGRMTPGFRPTQ